MLVRDLLKMEIDIDVYDNVCEELSVAFCGPAYLTPEGEKEFAEALDFEVELVQNPKYEIAIVNVDFGDWEHNLHEAGRLFYSLAGYCAADDYEKWFADL